MIIGITLLLIVVMAMVFRDAAKHSRAGNFLITDSRGFKRIEHSQADADAWEALGFTVTKLR